MALIADFDLFYLGNLFWGRLTDKDSLDNLTIIIYKSDQPIWCSKNLSGKKTTLVDLVIEKVQPKLMKSVGLTTSLHRLSRSLK